MRVVILAEDADRSVAAGLSAALASAGYSASVFGPTSPTAPDIGRADAVMIVCSRASMSSVWMEQLAKTADARGKPLLLVARRDIEPAEFGSAQFAWIDDLDAVRALVAGALGQPSDREQAAAAPPPAPSLPAPAPTPAPAAAEPPSPSAAPAAPKPSQTVIPTPAPPAVTSAIASPAPPATSPPAARLQGLSVRDLARLRGSVSSDGKSPRPQEMAKPVVERLRPGASVDEPAQTIRPPATPAPVARKKQGPESWRHEQPRTARHKSSPLGLVSGLAVLIAAGGLAFVFRDRLGDVAQEMLKNADKLLAVLGLSKGAMPPLPASATPTPVQADLVDCSVFAPQAVPKGNAFLVQVFLHQVDQDERVAFLAAAIDDSARLRGRQTLQLPIARRTNVRVEIDGRGVLVDEPVQELIWNGEPNVATFSCSMPAIAEAMMQPVVRLFVDDFPVGRIVFQVASRPSARDGGANSTPELTGLKARRYQRAFFSYSSHDRAEVLKRAQALSVAGISYFMDQQSLAPGEDYELRIRRMIGDCDLFMLFWSRNARESSWVAKEIDIARACQMQDPLSMPDIIPVMLEDPRDAPPPERLGDRHFNDTIAALIAYEERRPKGSGGFLSRWFGWK